MWGKMWTLDKKWTKTGGLTLTTSTGGSVVAESFLRGLTDDGDDDEVYCIGRILCRGGSGAGEVAP